MKSPEEVKEYLAKIRKTIDESNRLIEAANLRIAETDRLLASQGLTREQVSKMSFTKEQRELVNNELKKRGMDPIQDWGDDIDAMNAQVKDSRAVAINDDSGDVAARSRKFGVFMQGMRL